MNFPDYSTVDETRGGFERIGPIELPLQTAAGTEIFDVTYFEWEREGRWAAAALGDVTGAEPAPLRIESACLFGHVLGSAQCDCGWQLIRALEEIVSRGRGLVVYGIDQDARGLGIAAHFRIYELRQREGLDTSGVYERLQAPMDARSYEPVATILGELGVSSVELMSNNKGRAAFLREKGFEVVTAPLEAPITQHNMGTLMLEKEDLGYEVGYTTHTEWLRKLQDRVEHDPDLRGVCVVAGTERELCSLVSSRWDVSRELGELPEGGDEQLVAYVTDLPREDELAVYAERGVGTVVVPLPRIPRRLVEAGRSLGIRLQDWSRANRYASPRPQWELLGEDGDVSVYRRGEEVRLVEPGEEPRWTQLHEDAPDARAAVERAGEASAR
jgi:GTP cyclohydrolase II